MTPQERKVMERAYEALLVWKSYGRGGWDAQDEEVLVELRQCIEQQPSAQEQTTRLAHLDGVIPNAIRGYLRRCSSGGMPKKQIEIVQANVDEAERLGYFKLAIAQSMLAAEPEQKGEMK